MTRILIVEDSHVTAMAEAYQLWNAGYEVETVGSIQSAHDSIDKHPADLIILDYELPDSNGLQFLKTIREQESQVPVIMVTSRTDEHLVVEAMKQGALNYVVKSGEMLESLVSLVEEALEEGTRNRERAEFGKALKRSEEISRVLLNASHTAVFMVNPEGNILTINQAGKDLFHVDVDDTIMNILPAFSDADESPEPVASSPLQMVLETKGPVQVESKYNGQYIEHSLWPILGPGEKVDSVAVYSRDITQRWQAERSLKRDKEILEKSIQEYTDNLVAANLKLRQEINERIRIESALRTSENRLNKAQEIAHLGSWELNLKTRQVVCSGETFRILGIDPETFGGAFQEFLDCIHSEDHPYVEDALLKAAREEIPFNMEHRIINSGSGLRTVFAQGETSRDNTGKPTRMIGIFQDITDRKKAENDQLLLATAMEQAAESIVISNAQAQIEYVNPAFETITGFSREEVLGKSLAEYYAGDDPGKTREELETTLGAGEAWHGRLNGKKKNGAGYDLEVTVSPILDSSGAVTNHVSVSRDMTKQYQLEAELHQSQKLEAIGTMVSGISHEINNILTPILGYAEMLEERMEMDSNEKDFAKKIITSVLRARDVLSQILTFSRKNKNELRPVQIDTLIREALKLMSFTLPKNVSLRENISREKIMVESNSTLLQMILMNLFVNSGHAMPKGGELTITLDEVKLDAHEISPKEIVSGRFARLRVSDTGQGMDKVTMERIFEPFYTTKEVGKGTGLGLYTVYNIVKQHQGFVVVTSVLGEGTAFEIHFPLFDPEPENEKSEMLYPDIQGKNSILLVDDEKESRIIEKILLEEMGYRVTLAQSGQEALGILSESRRDFDIVIADLMCAPLTGEQLAKEIRGKYIDLKFLMCIDNSNDLSCKITQGLEIEKIIVKPFTPEELGKILKEILKPERAKIISLPLPTDHSPRILQTAGHYGNPTQ